MKSKEEKANLNRISNRSLEGDLNPLSDDSEDPY